jgi:hypothetical protein
VTSDPGQPGMGVYIGLRDIYDQQQAADTRMTASVNAVKESISGMSAQMAVFIAWQQQADRLHRNLESRVTALERWRYALPGSLILALLSLAGVIVQAVARFNGH